MWWIRMTSSAATGKRKLWKRAIGWALVVRPLGRRSGRHGRSLQLGFVGTLSSRPQIHQQDS